MKRLIYISLISFLLFSCTKVEKDYYPDGSLKSEIRFRGETRSGISTWYHRNGNKQMEVNYVDNEMDGKLVRWYYNGSLEMEETYEKGILNGAKRTWDEDGNLRLVSNYQNGDLHGDYTFFYPDEYPQIEGQYIDGKYDGKWFFYAISGMIVGEGIFENGTGTQTEINYQGRVTKITNYKDNLKDGWEFTFDDNGDTLNRFFYSKGVIQ